MNAKKRILLKVTGKIFLSDDETTLSNKKITSLAKQIKQLESTHQFCIVVGGGNFFRGSVQGKALGLTPSTGHTVGMLATVMNGLLLQDLFKQKSIKTTLCSAVFAPEIINPINQEQLDKLLQDDKTVIFSGGTGVPFFTTDTNAIVRALQVKADQVWKATDVNGIYDTDPQKNSDASLITTMRYSDALQKKIGIMDATSFALAWQHNLIIRIFNLFEDDALVRTAKEKDFGSTIN
ncbi:uridine monophosphate kinase [bacterium]|nr:uridine monophosphate kinase [bacterium]